VKCDPAEKYDCLNTRLVTMCSGSLRIFGFSLSSSICFFLVLRRIGTKFHVAAEYEEKFQ